MKIYIDIVLIENILMNYIILYTTGFIIKEEMKFIRLLLSSTVGSIYAIAAYLKIIPMYSNIIIKIILSSIMIFIAFNPKNIKKMFKELIVFYLASFAIGGCAFALLYLISPERVIYNNGVMVGMYPLKVTIIAGIIGFIIIQISFNQNKRKLEEKDLICNLEIAIDGKKERLKAYIDSGNTLRDPITQESVIIVEKSKVQKIVNIADLMGGDNKRKFRIIPFKSIGNINGMLFGIKADEIKIEYDGKDYQTKNVIVGIYNKEISKKYSALIGLELLEGGTKIENSRNNKYSMRKTKPRTIK